MLTIPDKCGNIRPQSSVLVASKKVAMKVVFQLTNNLILKKIQLNILLVAEERTHDAQFRTKTLKSERELSHFLQGRSTQARLILTFNRYLLLNAPYPMRNDYFYRSLPHIPNELNPTTLRLPIPFFTENLLTNV